MTVRVAITADWHGYLPPEIPGCDLLVVAGDIGLDERFDHVGTRLTELWRWIEALPMPVVAVAGNHDFTPEVLRALPWIYLQDEAVTVAGLRVWGSPWSNPFGHGWAFNMTEEDQTGALRAVPDDTQIIVSHGPPFGSCDLVYRDEHVGSRALATRMAELPDLRLVACGHVHERYGRDGIVVNGSLVDSGYRIRNAPIVVEL